VTAIANQTVVNPLNIRYWSMTPYCFGSAAAKFSARPAGAASPFTATQSPDYLHDNLVLHLGEMGASFDFMVQLRAQPDAMPIEDPTIVWDEDAAPFVPVATITIPPQVSIRSNSTRSARICPSTLGTASGAPRVGRHQPGTSYCL
jgi:hypothetical protein